MSSRTLLIIFGALIVAGIVALLVALQTSPSTDGPSAATPAPRVPDAPAGDDPTGSRSRPAVAPTGPSPDDDDDDDDDVLEYMTDGGILVRDHRADKSAPAPLSNLPQPGRTHRMKPDSVAAVRNVLRPIVRRCERAVTAASLGTEPVLQVVVTVSVKDQRLTVDKVDTHTKDIASTELGDCVREGFAGQQLDVPTEEDIPSYDLTHPFRIKGA